MAPSRKDRPRKAGRAAVNGRPDRGRAVRRPAGGPRYGPGRGGGTRRLRGIVPPATGISGGRCTRRPDWRGVSTGWHPASIVRSRPWIVGGRQRRRLAGR